MLLDQKRSASLIIGVHGIISAADITHYNLEDIEVRAEMLEGYWMEYAQRDFILQRVSESLKDRSYFKENQFASTQVKYLQAKARMKERIRTLSAAALATANRAVGIGSGNPNGSASTINNNSSLQASLEKLRLPRFDGKQRDWEAFKEKFSSLIISDQMMSSIIKFRHLFNCLDGEAAEKLKGIKVTGDNFETAWDTLCRRYDNKYLRFSLQMQTLVNLPSASNESVRHLSQLLNTVNESINTFNNLERPVEKWDDILVYFLESKLAVKGSRKKISLYFSKIC